MGEVHVFVCCLIAFYLLFGMWGVLWHFGVCFHKAFDLPSFLFKCCH